MKSLMLTMCLLGLMLWPPTLSLKICAFNVQSFGEAKAHNKKVMNMLIKIIARCDLCLVQEVRDSKGEAIPTLVKHLNREQKAGKDELQGAVCVHIPEGGSNHTKLFTREPFIIRIYSPSTLVKDFVLVGQHTSPKNAMKEIEELYGVYTEISKKWKTQNVMFLGDLNAACSYITVKGWKAIRLRNDPKFHWLIGDEEDTTVRDNTRCAYDRIVVHGKELYYGIVPDSAQPFNFKKEFQLSEEEALEVSDHYPVEVDLKPNHRYLLRHEL
ncbi:hypothetical protein ACEWY4_000579 [Coilia grayii]|uniref:Deoxyribonuclease n=1 Tax=Coilia grayii TaxID=363190 RepID=A0ABD1KXL0_9TELE